jgi:hypothetical protein
VRFTKSELESYRNLIDRYRLATGKKHYTAHEVLEWAERREEIDFTPAAIRRFHLTALAEASRSDTATDGEGNKIRLRMCVETQSNGDADEPVQQTLWAVAAEAETSFLVEALRQHHERIAADVAAYQVQERYVNSLLRGRGHEEVQLSLDFSEPWRAEDAG